MTKRVLLIVNAPKNPRLFINVLPPIGILSIAAYLEAEGIPTTVRDCNIDAVTDRDIANADVVGLSLNISNVETSLESARYIKRSWPDKQIVAGGPLAMSIPSRLIRCHGIDAVAVSEGEELMSELALGKRLETIKGLYLKERTGGDLFTGRREWLKHLDSLPFPALHKVELRRYYSPVKKALPISNIITSRGCPYSCIYCFKAMGNKWRARSPGNVADEIEWQVRDLGVKEICIYDDNFTMDVRRAERICDEIISRKIKVHLQLTNGIRADRLSRNTLKKLKAAGVWIVGIAPESGNRETLRRIGKGLNLKDVSRAVRWCKEEGLFTYSFFMMGFPWETPEQIEDTISYAVRLDTELTQFSRVTAFPGTRLCDIIGAGEESDSSPLCDQGLFYGGVSHDVASLPGEFLKRAIKRAYRKVYLRPGKWIRLLRMLSFSDLWKLFFYSVTTGSI